MMMMMMMMMIHLGVIHATKHTRSQTAGVVKKDVESQSYGASPAIWDHTVLPACHRRTLLLLLLLLFRKDVQLWPIAYYIHVDIDFT